MSHVHQQQGKEVVLDSATGDFYIFDAKSDRWLAEGNVGILKTGAGLGGVAAAILADACGNMEGYGKKRAVSLLAFSSCKFVALSFVALSHIDPYNMVGGEDTAE